MASSRHRVLRSPLCVPLAAAAAAIAAAIPALTGQSASACEHAALYTPSEGWADRTGFHVGVAEQYSQATTELLDGQEVPNPFGEHLYTSTTQVFAGYRVNRRIGLQLNLPVIVKSWRRVVGHDRIQESTKGGLGDLSLIADLLAFEAAGESGAFRFGLLGGLKFPTGDASFLGEEMQENGDMEEEMRARLQRAAGHQHEAPSGVHGHDLTFGTGSVDGIVGGRLYWSHDRFFVTATMLYTATTEGSFGYQFADRLSWLGGPGYRLLVDHGSSFALQAVLSGETKGKDTQHGVALDDTAATALYVGPGVSFTWGENLAAELEADLPAIQNDTGLQIAPDFRLRGAVIWHF